MARIRTSAEAEFNAANQMQRLGYRDATVLLAGADEGIDVHSSRASAQVKWRGGCAGRSNLQSLYRARGTSRSRKLLYFSGSGYTDEAVEYADEVGIALFRCEPDGQTPPIGAHAPKLVAAVSNSTSTSAPPSPPLLPSKPESPVRALARGIGAALARRLVAHWRLLGAVVCTLVLMIAPFGEGFVALRVLSTILAVVGAPVFWLLFVVHRRDAGA
ncbi:restriction endonuclease [Rhodococcus sp. WMMA185]|uniref:restriction endonuclease n=1 Tax=Rhodococcus sp. WMMA185 TaxID=679318 RepID=UPI000877F41E|nr:restriction endonuclease [Rhodococcus sp. WMMA185]AOW93096.1 restriction endonuclease [Rhodococcus sp. WMMA185]